MIADPFNSSGFAELLIVVALGLLLAALAEGLVKRHQSQRSHR